MLVDERALLIVAIVISMLSLLTNMIELSVLLSIRPIVERLVDAMSGVQQVNSELLKAIAILTDRTARSPNE